jgi:hypothetical protein
LKVHIPSSAKAREEAKQNATIAGDALKLDSFCVLVGFCAIPPVSSRATAKIAGKRVLRGHSATGAMMADPTKLLHQDNPENPNEDLSDERQRKKAKVESGDEPEPEPSNDRKKRAGTPGRPASSGRHR